MKLLLSSVLAASMAAIPVGTEVIERIMAVVDGSLILQSDVRAATRLRLVPGADELGTEAVLERLIERRLSLVEVNRYAPQEPEQVLVERRVAEVRARFPTWEAFEAALVETGITLEQLAQHLRDDLRLEVYIQQRFGGTVQPTEAEILQYYREHQDAFTRDGIVRPFGEAHADARAALVEERRAATVREWVAGLRRRSTVTIPGIVPSK